jgi:hypothetical protein
MDLPVNDGGSGRSARGWHGRQPAPAVACGIIFECIRLRALVNRNGEAAEREELATEFSNGDVVAGFRQRRARLPHVRDRIIRVMRSLRDVVQDTANLVQLSEKHGGGRFGPWRWERLLLAPSSASGLRVRESRAVAKTYDEHRNGSRSAERDAD